MIHEGHNDLAENNTACCPALYVFLKYFLIKNNVLKYCHGSKYIVSNILLFNVLLSFVIGMDGAESLYGRGGERDPRRTTHILHPLHLTNAPLKNTKARGKWTFSWH